MACFSIPCCTGSFLTPNRLKIRNFRVYRGLCPSTKFKFNQCYNFENGFVWNKKFEYYSRKSRIFSLRRFQQNGVDNEFEPHVSSRSRDDRKSDSGKGGSGNRLKKRFSLRLRPRLRLLVMRLRRAYEVQRFNRKNSRTVVFATLFSIVFTLCFLFSKFTSRQRVKTVPYSDLIVSLRNGNVEKVLVEEGTRRIYYNMVSENVENDRVTDEQESQQVVDVLMDKDIGEVVSENAVKSGRIPVLKKFSKRRTSIPEWQYSTRKIDHDEKFLLSLMREKGVTFSSAPQSVFAAMRSTLITVITLWIPFIPLMWLLYRQVSAANSPAKKRKPNSQTVGFEDVQGVDSAKVELMEVIIS